MDFDNILIVYVCLMVVVSIHITSHMLKWAPPFSVTDNDHLKEHRKNDDATQKSKSSNVIILTKIQFFIIGFIALYIYSATDNHGLFLFGFVALVLMMNGQKRVDIAQKTDRSRPRARLESVKAKAIKYIAIGSCIDSIIVHVDAWITWWLNDSCSSHLPVLPLSCSFAFMLASIMFLMKIRIISVIIMLCVIISLCTVGFISFIFLLGIMAGGISP